jgi:hypothetical protein
MSSNLIIVLLPIRLVVVRAHKTRLIPATVDVTTNRIGKLTMIRLGLIKLG